MPDPRPRRSPNRPFVRKNDAALTVLSLHTAAPLSHAPRTRGQFELLVRHLLDRFFNNDMISIGGDTIPLLLTVAYAIALPTVIMAALAYPGYHGFPPHPHVPPFWSQVGDHYFYVVYSFVAMGAVTVFEWDLLFPNVLDLFILSPLPLSNRRMLLARFSAVLVFLTLFLIGTASLGIVFFPMITEVPGFAHFVGHFLAVAAAGAFAAAFFLALQGVLLTLLGARLFRVASTFLQTLSMTVLLTLLFLFPLVSRSVEPLILSPSPAVRLFPPFWFLGMYECVLAGPARLPAFARLAHIGVFALLTVVLLALLTYPLAYQRKARREIEGSVARHHGSRALRPLFALLHCTFLRSPSRRAVFHFIGQTLVRTQRHRVYLAMYAGLGIALIAAFTLNLTLNAGRIALVVSPYGLRLALPVLVFWIVAGLGTALASPADPAGAWLFHVILGTPAADHLIAARLWVLTWALFVTLPAGLCTHLVAPPGPPAMQSTATQMLVALGLSLLLTDAFFLPLRIIPFTEARVPHNTDLAFLLLRYIVAFPAVVLTTVAAEPWIESSRTHVLLTVSIIGAAHFALQHLHAHLLEKHPALAPAGQDPPPFLTLDLRG